jgi:hypothetical protein
MKGRRVEGLKDEKNPKFHFPNPKDRGTTALLKTQYPMNSTPHLPIPPFRYKPGGQNEKI